MSRSVNPSPPTRRRRGWSRDKGEPMSLARSATLVRSWVIVLALLIPCFATTVLRKTIKQKGAGAFFQIHHGAKWGYIDRHGKAVIPPQFDDEGDFFGGLAKVRIGAKWGYVDESGHLTIPYQFDYAGDFREGLAPVQVDRKWGFIDTAGKIAIDPQFQAASEFSDGLAQFEIWDSIHCEPLDRMIGPNVYTNEKAPLYAFRLHNNPDSGTVGCFPPDAQYGFVDKRGNIVVKPAHVGASGFSEGLAVVRMQKSSEWKYGYIDKTGKTVIEPQFDQAYSFSEGLAAVEVGLRVRAGKKVAGAWGFIGRDGRFAIQPRFEDARSFSEGLATVSESGSWGYIDTQGTFVIAPKYSQAEAFSEGLALVWPQDEPEDEEDAYYIDKAGRKALVVKLSLSGPFSDGLTVAGKLGERKYVDRNGRIVAPYEVDPRP